MIHRDSNAEKQIQGIGGPNSDMPPTTLGKAVFLAAQ